MTTQHIQIAIKATPEAVWTALTDGARTIWMIFRSLPKPWPSEVRKGGSFWSVPAARIQGCDNVLTHCCWRMKKPGLFLRIFPRNIRD